DRGIRYDTPASPQRDQCHLQREQDRLLHARGNELGEVLSAKRTADQPIQPRIVLVERGGEYWLAAVQLRCHAGIERSLTGEEEDDARRLASDRAAVQLRSGGQSLRSGCIVVGHYRETRRQMSPTECRRRAGIEPARRGFALCQPRCPIQ